MKSVKLLAILLLISFVLCGYAFAATDLSDFAAKHPQAKMVLDDNNKLKMLLDFKAPTPLKFNYKEKAYYFLNENKQLLNISTPRKELMIKSATPLRHSSVVRMKQTWNGLHVWKGGVSIAFDLDGNAVRVHNNFKEIPAMNPNPTITPYEAIVEAWASVYGTETSRLSPKELDKEYAKLLVWTGGEVAKLAYVVKMPIPIPIENKVAFIDAHSGRFISSLDLVKYAYEANVYEYNPGADSTTPAATVVRELVNLTEPATPKDTDEIVLDSELHQVYNCPGKQMYKIPIPGYNMEIAMCTEEHVAKTAYKDQDFKYDPVLLPFTDLTAQSDAFAEVHMYYHVEKIYSFLQDLSAYIVQERPGFDGANNGFDFLTKKPLKCLVNFKVPAAIYGGSEKELAQWDNAFFTPQGGIAGMWPDTDAIVFGQGEKVDFAYDADVIYHEFVHAMIGSTIELLNYSYDKFGTNSDPGAINEGFADYFSATYIGEPKMAEYAGSAFEQQNALRDLTNTKKCPDDAHGEVHDDSEYWSAALWEIREEYKVSDTDHKDVDAAIYEALLEMSSDINYTQAATLMAEKIGEWFDTDRDDTAKNFALAVFNKKGVIDCNRVKDLGLDTSFKGAITLPSNSDSDFNFTPHAPGPLQFKVTLDSVTDYVMAEFYTSSGGGGMFGMGGSDPEVTFMIKKDAPIEFTYTKDQGYTKVETTVDGESAIAQKMQGGVGVPNAQAWGTAIAKSERGQFEAGDYYIIPVNKAQTRSNPSLQLLKFTAKTGDLPCFKDADCGDMCQVCKNMACEVIPAECEKDEDCQDGKVCIPGDCGGLCKRQAVEIDGDEETAEQAEPELEATEPEKAGCVTSGDCAECQECIGDMCMDVAPECGIDKTCPDGKVCDTTKCNGTCIADPNGSIDGDTESEGGNGVDMDGSSSGCNQSNGMPLSIMLMFSIIGILVYRRRQTETL